MQRSGTAPTTCQGRPYKSRPSQILDYEITFKNVRTKNAHSDRVHSNLLQARHQCHKNEYGTTSNKNASVF